MPGALDGIKVLDLSWGIAGPVTGMLLADHGADVVKVEPPGGDPFRGMSGYATWLRGRRSIELDLKADGDRGVLHDLARSGGRRDRELGPGDGGTTGCRRHRSLANQSRPDRLLAVGLRRPPGAPGPTGLRRTRRGPPRDPRRTTGASGRRDRTHARRGAVPRAPRDPRWHGTRGTTARTDLHLHPMAEHGVRLHRHHRHQRRALRTSDDRPWPAHRDLPAAVGDLADRLQVDAGGAQRRPVLPVLDLRPEGEQGLLPLLGRALDGAMGAQSPLRALEQRGGSARGRSELEPTARRPATACRPTRRTSWCWRTTSSPWPQRWPASHRMRGSRRQHEPASRCSRSAPGRGALRSGAPGRVRGGRGGAPRARPCCVRPGSSTT